MTGIWWRWSWRDLRSRWLQVGAIALIIALGVGTSAGLSSTAAWRQESYDASYRALRLFDLRATLPPGTFAPRAAMAAAGDELRQEGIAAATAVQTEGSIQLDASGPSAVLVPGRVVGVVPGQAAVNRLEITRGRGLTPQDVGKSVVVLDEHFAARRSIPVGATVRLSGGVSARVVGRALSPEHFIVLGDQGRILSDADYAILYTSQATASRLLSRPETANVLVMRRAVGVPEERARRALVATMARAAPGAAVTVIDRDQEPTRRLLYRDVEGDQRLYDIFAILILLGAAFAAFNLIARIIEAQRREIGVGMALGVPTAELTIRPLLLGLQIAMLGTALGALVGWGLGLAMVGFLESFLPLPVWRNEFQFASFGRAAIAGVLVPFLATVFPVWRAVRVSPVEAIAPRVRGARRWGWRRARASGRGHSIGVLPLRNVVRAPRRTVLTALGIAAALAVLLGLIGMVDSFRATIAQARTELVARSPGRVTVTMASFGSVDSPPFTTVAANDLVERSTTEVQVPAQVAHHGQRIDVLTVIADLDGPIWRPRVEERLRGPGIVLTSKAIADLRVQVGDRVTVRYPRRDGLGYRFVTETIRVVGASPFPLRSLAWMDDTDGLDRTNLVGIANVIVLVPKPGVTADQIVRSLFPIPGVASVQPVTAFTDSIAKEVNRALGILVIVEGIVLLLALLVAFNAASINADDRARDHATMFAFGLPVRSVLGMEIAESALVGVVGTAIGIGAGWWLLDWMNTSLLPNTIPDLSITTAVSDGTVVLAVAMGVIAVALAPVLTLRKLARMDIPSTLRVVE